MQLMSGRAAQRTKNEAMNLQSYSKQWAPGDVLRAYYPIFWQDGLPEIAVGAIWGHNVGDVKELGLQTIFIPSTNEFSKDGQPIGTPDITYQFSRIARVFIEARKKVEEKTIADKQWPSESAKRKAFGDLEAKYSKDAKNPVKPIISNPIYKIFTEVLSVKLTNDKPDINTIAVSSANMSSQLIDQLYMILGDSKYALTEEDQFLEVEWKYPVNSEKSESGRIAKPAGLTFEYRICNQFPELYNQISQQFGKVSRDPTSIIRRATRSVDLARVKSALTSYCYLNSQGLDLFTDGEDARARLVSNSDVVKELDFLGAITNADLVKDINEKLAEMDVQEKARNAIEAKTQPEEIPEPAAILPDAPNIDQVLEDNAAAERELELHATNIPQSTMELLQNEHLSEEEGDEDLTITMPAVNDIP